MPHPRVTASRSRYQPPSSALQRKQGCRRAGRLAPLLPPMHRAAGHGSPKMAAGSLLSRQRSRPAGGWSTRAGRRDAAGRAFALSISDAKSLPPHTPSGSALGDQQPL